ncbi:DUF397 domain-containing protein [Actinomadura sp. NPDC047616]|uniref:DUF397 domain-containing protein n=1 Tax=Actinomadura sp. NPDC047616 TaxID=3155914 RepID=UPI0033D1BCB1
MTAPDLYRARWRKSRRSEGSNACVEVAGAHQAIAVRDSKDPEGPHLVLTRSAWQGLVRQARGGALDL